MAKVRIFQIAKELNLSHTDILNFLKARNIKVSSHMSPVDEATHKEIMNEFAKDKEQVDRFRKEQVRKEIHDTKLRKQQESGKKLELLSLTKQRELEKKESQKAENEQKLAEDRSREELKKQKAEDLADLELQAKSQKKENVLPKKENKNFKNKKQKELKKKFKPSKKLRTINLSDIQSEIGSGISGKQNKNKIQKQDEKVQGSIKTKVKGILAKIDTKNKKKQYRKSKIKVDEPIVDSDVKPGIKVAEFSNVEELSKIFNVTSSDVIQTCIDLGMLVTKNQRMDWDMIELLSDHFGFTAEKIDDLGEELFTFEQTEDDLKNAEERAPIVTVMGHVDHGKTSLLDYIRKTNVASGESGGITQHIGAYKVEYNKRKLTFLDTPGHEAFTAMRARGAQVTDIVILVVAADDAVMPQTIEAISHTKAAGVPMVVAINKIDKPGADAEKVRRSLSENDVLVESWGGKIQDVEISALKGDGIDKLMEGLLLETDVLELKANYKCSAKGSVVDSRLDKGLGPVGTVLIQHGTLKSRRPIYMRCISR